MRTIVRKIGRYLYLAHDSAHSDKLERLSPMANIKMRIIARKIANFYYNAHYDAQKNLQHSALQC